MHTHACTHILTHTHTHTHTHNPYTRTHPYSIHAHKHECNKLYAYYLIMFEYRIMHDKWISQHVPSKHCVYSRILTLRIMKAREPPGCGKPECCDELLPCAGLLLSIFACLFLSVLPCLYCSRSLTPAQQVIKNSTATQYSRRRLKTITTIIT